MPKREFLISRHGVTMNEKHTLKQTFRTDGETPRASHVLRSGRQCVTFSNISEFQNNLENPNGPRSGKGLISKENRTFNWQYNRWLGITVFQNLLAG